MEKKASLVGRLLSENQMSEAFINSMFLALSGGFQDAYTYNCRDEVFSNAQTGNVVLMSQNFLEGNFTAGLRYLFPILFFAMGVFLAENFQEHYRYAKRLHWRQVLLAAEIVILAIVGFIPSSYNMLAAMLVSFACAIQVQTFRKVGGYSYASTMCIGNLQSGTASLQRSVFAPLPLLNIIHETYSAYAEDYQQTFIYDVPESLPDVTGNPDRTQQVLIALLDNAFKYTPEGGTVTLSAAVEGDVVRIRVRDTGVGISKEDLPHVFDRFYKVDKSHHGKGTGLGLAIAYEIMKHLGEEMSVTSELNQGSCFTFTLHIAKSSGFPSKIA